MLAASHDLYHALDIFLQNESLNFALYQDKQSLVHTESTERVSAALCTIMSLCDGSIEITHPDETWLDRFIVELDHTINQQLDYVLHHPEFQALESSWRSVEYLIQKIECTSPVKVEILNCSKKALLDDFQSSRNICQSSLYHHVYHMEYDMPGGDPITAMVSDYFFSSTLQDIDLLKAISQVAEMAHCPFLANVSPQFFDKTNFKDVLEIENLARYMERAEYIHWSSFREFEASRYIALLMPRFLLRLNYGNENPVSHFNYIEAEDSGHGSSGLWGAASIAFAVNMVRSFEETGWLMNIRGPESGGKVSDLPIPHFKVGHGLFLKSPTEVLISESKELALAELGFIPLSYYKNSNYACFFSANTVKLPIHYTDASHTANSRVNARLPYVLLISRLGHYLKVLQREVIGSDKNADELALRLNAWLQRLVTKMRDPSPEIARRYPLREGYVKVTAMLDNPGYFKVNLFVVPHFQVEGFDIQLSLLAKLPGVK